MEEQHSQTDPDQGEDKAYLEPYLRAVEHFGPGFEATLWGSRKAQVLRFDVMIDLTSFHDRVIVDAGCAHGEFAARLLERGIEFGRYVGIDALKEVIAAARLRHLPRCSFEAADIVADPRIFGQHDADYICFSGTLNTMTQEMAQGLIEAAFDTARFGVLFNFLSDRHHPRWNEQELGPAMRHSTTAWLDWAMSKTARVAFTQAYMDGHDATIMMQKEEPES